MKTFEEILGSVSTDAFVDESWGKQPRIIEGLSDKFTHLFDWGLLNTMLQADFLRAPRLRLVSQGERIDSSKYLREVRSATSLDPTGLAAALREGAALVLDNVDALFPAIGDAAQAVESFFGTTAQVNLYIGCRASKGFDIHFDLHDVIVLQVEGSKDWQVWEPTQLHPLDHDKPVPPNPDQEPYWEGTLTAGDIVYLPRGWWHHAKALDETSVHLTMGIRAPTATDFLVAMHDNLVETSATMRASLPLPNAVGAATKLPAEIAGNADDDALQLYIENRAAEVWVRPVFDLPNSLSPVSEADITGETRLKLAWTHGLSFRDNQDGTLRVSSIGVNTSCSAALKPWLKRLDGLDFVSLDDIRAGLDDRKLRRELGFLISTLAMKGAVLTA